MPSITLRELRDTKQLKAWLRQGETVELRERNRILARILPASTAAPGGKWPDFEADAKEIFGDRILPGADILIAERGRY
jgi:antitoxin (DNA-binding transcriptional repressor) of toxin-antitoxin stability system